MPKKAYLQPGQAGLNRLYGEYKRSATRRGLSFKISKKHFKNLTSSPCFYCGDSPSSVRFEHNTLKSNQKRTAYIFNGIDRKNNNEGYTLDNAVPCCAICNRAKYRLTEKQFKQWIYRLCKNQK